MTSRFDQLIWQCDVQSSIKMGGKGGGQNTNTVQSAPPADVTAAYDQTMAQAQQVASTPLTQYGGQMVAGFTPMQQQAFSNVEANQGVASPYINAAAQLTGQGAAPINVPGGYTSDQLAQLAGTGVQYGVNAAGTNIAGASQPSFSSAMNSAGTNVYGQIPQYNASTLSQYMSPYTQNVVNATQAEFNNQNAQAQQGVIGNAISKGAWGGDRAGIAQAELANQQQLAQAPVIAGLEQSGYTNAQQALQGQQQLAATTLGQQAQLGAQTGLGVGTAQQTAAQQQAALQQATAQQLLGLYSGQQNTGVGAQEASGWLAQNAGFGMGNLGNMAQSTTTADTNQLMSAGGLQQQLQQEQLNVPYQMYTQQQAYPFQTTGWLGGIAEGLGSSAGGTTTSTSPSQSSLGELAGLGMTGLGAYALYNAANPSSAAPAATTQARGGRTPHGFDAGGSVPDLGGIDTQTQTQLRAHPVAISSGFIPAPPPPKSGMNPSNIQAPAAQQNNTAHDLMSTGEGGLGAASAIRRDRPASTALGSGMTHVTPRVVTNLPMEHGSMVGGGVPADSPSQTWSYDSTGHLIPQQAHGGSVGFADGGAPPTPTQSWMTPAGPTTTAGGFHAPSTAMPAMPTPDTSGGSPVTGYSQIQGRPGAFIPTLGSPSLNATTSPHLTPFTGGQQMTGSVPTALTKNYTPPNAAGVNGNPTIGPNGTGTLGVNLNAQGVPVLVSSTMPATSPSSVPIISTPSDDGGGRGDGNGGPGIDQNAARGGVIHRYANGGPEMSRFRGSSSTTNVPAVPVGTQVLNAGMTAMTARNVFNQFKPGSVTGTPATSTPAPGALPGSQSVPLNNTPPTPADAQMNTLGSASPTTPITPTASTMQADTTPADISGFHGASLDAATSGSDAAIPSVVAPASTDAAGVSSLSATAPAAAAGDAAALADTATTAAEVGDLAAAATAAGEGSAASEAALLLLAAKRGGAIGFKAAGGPVLPESAGMGFGLGGALHRDLGGAADTVDPQAAQLSAGSNPMMGRQLSAVNAAPQQGGLTNEQTQEYAHAHGVPMMARSANMSPAAIALANTQRMHGFSPPTATQARGGVPHGFASGGSEDEPDALMGQSQWDVLPTTTDSLVPHNVTQNLIEGNKLSERPRISLPQGATSSRMSLPTGSLDYISKNEINGLPSNDARGAAAQAEAASHVGQMIRPSVGTSAITSAASPAVSDIDGVQPWQLPTGETPPVDKWNYDAQRDRGPGRLAFAPPVQPQPETTVSPDGSSPPVTEDTERRTAPAARDTQTSGFGVLPSSAPSPTTQPTPKDHDYLADVKPWTPGTYSALPKREQSAIERSPLGFALLAGGLKAMANPGLKNASPFVQLGRSIGVGGEGAVDAYGKQEAANREQQKIDQAAESQNYDKWYKGQNLSEKASSMSTDLAKTKQAVQTSENTAAETRWKDMTGAQRDQFKNNIDLFKAHIEATNAEKGQYVTFIDPKSGTANPYVINDKTGTVYGYDDSGKLVPKKYTPEMGIPATAGAYRSFAPTALQKEVTAFAVADETPAQTIGRLSSLKKDPQATAKFIESQAAKLMSASALSGTPLTIDQARASVRNQFDAATTTGTPAAPGSGAPHSVPAASLDAIEAEIARRATAKNGQEP